MQTSSNYGLKLMEGTDNVKRQDFVDNFNIIDNGLSKFYVATLDSANAYKVTTGNSMTSLNNGYSIRVAIPSASTGAVSIIVDSVTVPVKKPNGNAVTNFKANGVYTLSYYNSVFTLASGGVDDVNFSAGDLLTGKNANNSDGEKVNGTMANNGAVTSTLTAGTSYTIPAGYHNGSGKITANSLASQTIGNAGADSLLSGHTAWVFGSKLTGTIPSMPFQTNALSVGSIGMNKYFRIPKGAYVNVNSDGVSEIVASATQIDSNIVASNIISGKSICGVNGTATLESLAESNDCAIINKNGQEINTYNFTVNVTAPTFTLKTGASGRYHIYVQAYDSNGKIIGTYANSSYGLSVSTDGTGYSNDLYPTMTVDSSKFYLSTQYSNFTLKGSSIAIGTKLIAILTKVA